VGLWLLAAAASAEPPEPAAEAPSCSASGPICPSYGACEPYRVADARCVCRCMGDDAWSESVRCCLWDLHKPGLDPDATHAWCWSAATVETGLFPLGKLTACVSLCAGKSRRCAEEFPEDCGALPDDAASLVALLDCTADLKLKHCAMARLRELHGAPVLLAALRGDNACIRAEAAHGLMAYDGPDVLTALLEAGRDRDAHVRMWAAWSLGERADPSALPLLRRLARDRRKFVRAMAAEAIEKIEAAAAARPSLLRDQPRYGDQPGR
jgi:hypothetical protein